MAIDLRPKQRMLFDGIRNAFKEKNRRIMVQAHCGFGKTRIAAAVCEAFIKKNPNKKIAFVCDMKKLVQQTVDSFMDLGLDVGVVMSDHHMYAPWKQIQVCSAQTLERRKETHYDFYIYDEGHSLRKHTKELMDRLNLVPFLALSGTPISKGLGLYFDTMVMGPSMNESIDDGHILPSVCYSTKEIDTKGIKTVQGDYDQSTLAVRANQINADIVDTYLSFGEDRKTILFPVNVLHSKNLVNEFNLAGVPSAHIDAHTPEDERDDIFKALKDGEIQLVSSVGCLSKGFDEVSINCCILAFATKSRIKYLQAAHRASRSFEDQDDFILLDHGTNVIRLGFPEQDLPDTLCMKDKDDKSSKDNEDEDKKEVELKPKKCPDCHKLVEAKVFTCPSCGHIFAKRSEVEVEAGELVKIERTPAEKRNRTTSKEVKQDFFSSALGYCYAKGYKEGWASNKYREYFGVWPNKMAKIAGSGSIEFDNFMKYQRIKWAKGHKLK